MRGAGVVGVLAAQGEMSVDGYLRCTLPTDLTTIFFCFLVM